MGKNIVKIQRVGAKCLISIPREVLSNLGGIDYLAVKFDDGQLIYTPVEL